MAQKIDVNMPPGLDLPAGWTVRVTALSPSDGSVISGVKVSNVVISGAGTTALGALEPVPPLLVNEEPPS